MKILVTGGSGFIGRQLMAQLASSDLEAINVDTAAPSAELARTWRNVSILDREALRALFRDYRPTHVVHLAANSSVYGKSLDDYRANTEGTRFLLEACAETASLERVMVTSTQHVRRPGSGPARDDTDYLPYKYYGQSKVIAEQLTRRAALKFTWTIVRPTAVWGPHHVLLADGLWKFMARGLYFHPKPDPVVRSYGYVKNVAWQLGRLLSAPSDAVHGRVIYVADGNTRQEDWVDAFARALTGRNSRKVPLSFIRLLSAFGDTAKRVGARFPMYEERLQNLTANNPVPIEPTLDLLGAPPHSFESGIKETVGWLREYWARRPA